MNINKSSRISILSILSMITGSLLISGCLILGPEYKPPEENVPDAWRSAAIKDIESSDTSMHVWWECFKDDDLNSIICNVRSNNLTLAAGLARIEEAAAQYGIARSALMPEVGASGSYARFRDTERVKNNKAFLENPYNAYDTGFNLSWEVDLWGRVKRGVQAASANFESNIEDYRDLLVILQAQAANSYIQIRTAQQRLLFARTNVNLQKKTLKLTQDRFEAELTGELDVRQAEMNIAATLALIPQLESALTKNINSLCVLTGKHPGAYADLLKAEKKIPVISQLPTMLPVELIRQRPDIRAAERRLAAQTALIGVARGELYPMFSLNGNFEWAASSTGSLFAPQARTYGFGPSFQWSIFNFGRVYNSIIAEEARTSQALSVYNESVLTALSESESALTAYAKEMQRELILRDAVKAASRSTELVDTLYKNGLTNFQNVLDTQRQLFTHQDSLALSKGMVAVDLVNVYKAFGGGWQPKPADDNTQQDK